MATSTGVTLLLIVSLVLAASPAMARTRDLGLTESRDATSVRLSAWEQVQVRQSPGDRHRDPRRSRPGLGDLVRLARAVMTPQGVLARLAEGDTERPGTISDAPRAALLNLPPPTLA